MSAGLGCRGRGCRSPRAAAGWGCRAGGLLRPGGHSAGRRPRCGLGCRSRGGPRSARWRWRAASGARSAGARARLASPQPGVHPGLAVGEPPDPQDQVIHFGSDRAEACALAGSGAEEVPFAGDRPPGGAGKFQRRALLSRWAWIAGSRPRLAARRARPRMMTLLLSAMMAQARASCRQEAEVACGGPAGGAGERGGPVLQPGRRGDHALAQIRHSGLRRREAGRRAGGSPGWPPARAVPPRPLAAGGCGFRA